MSRHVYFSFFLISCCFISSCGVDPRWGPPRSGLRQNLAWQYSKQRTITTADLAATSWQDSAGSIAQPALGHQPLAQAQSKGKVTLLGKYAITPADAPKAVRLAVEAGNRLQTKGYRFGGGHTILNDTAYDCSGAVSYVLREAGLLNGQMPSRGFLNYGASGVGKWITVWARNGHVFMSIGGLRLDTTGKHGDEGPRWRPSVRKKDGFVARHPRGL